MTSLPNTIGAVNAEIMTLQKQYQNLNSTIKSYISLMSKPDIDPDTLRQMCETRIEFIRRRNNIAEHINELSKHRALLTAFP